jgi:hypothetical protein
MTLALVLLWLLVAAAIVGPVVRYFRARPRSMQTFLEDQPSRPN